MRAFTCCVVLALSALCSTAQASTFRFDDDPFAGTTVLDTPGRQVVGGELFLSFTDSDQFSFDPSAFGVNGPAVVFNGPAGLVPASGVNVVVLETFDDDANALTPFGAGNAATLIANQITAPGAGFFVYFNQSLNLPRLVFSTDLSDPTADLRILARMLNLTGQPGRDALTGFQGVNFDVSAADVPEPASLALFGLGCATFGWRRRPRYRSEATVTGTTSFRPE